MTPPRDPNQLPVLDRATGLDDGYDCDDCGRPADDCACDDEGEYGCPECGFAGTCAGCDDYCPECNEAWAECECPIDEGELP